MNGPVLICGAGGMLAWDLARAFAAKLPPEKVIALPRAGLDITQPDSIASSLKYHRPTVVVNAAAYTNVDGAETERDRARAINGVGPAFLTSACRELGARLVHFSTDQVFDGSGEAAHRETDPTSPVNYYATTKLEGERAVLEEASSLVLRVQWLYGERKDRFTILKDKKTFTPFRDQVGAPTWTRHLAETVVQLVERNAAGLFHFAYDDYASWAEVFAFVCSEMHYSTELIPKATSEVSLPARRPLNSRMDNRKLVDFLGLKGLGSWKDQLRAFLASAVAAR